MMRVTIDINGRVISRAIIKNDSDLADVSDYSYRAEEEVNSSLGIKGLKEEGVILGHDRRQTAWSLVRKLAEILERSEKST